MTKENTELNIDSSHDKLKTISKKVYIGDYVIVELPRDTMNLFYTAKHKNLNSVYSIFARF